MARPTSEPKTERMDLRMSSDFIKRLNAWRKRHDDPPPRSEAIRQLVEIGLKHEESATDS